MSHWGTIELLGWSFDCAKPALRCQLFCSLNCVFAPVYRSIVFHTEEVFALQLVVLHTAPSIHAPAWIFGSAGDDTEMAVENW